MRSMKLEGPGGPRAGTRRPFNVRLQKLYKLQVDKLGLLVRLRDLARHLKGVKPEGLPQAPEPRPPAVG